MNIGQKITMLKESLGFKNFAEYGKAIGLPGEWLLELSKKESVQNIDITRLMRIAEYHNITLDELLKDNEGDYIIDVKGDLRDNDIGKMIDDIQEKLNETTPTYYGYVMNKECQKIAYEGLEILKGLIKNNL